MGVGTSAARVPDVKQARTRTVWLSLWLTVAQAFMVHAVVPGLTLRPYAFSRRTVRCASGAADSEVVEPTQSARLVHALRELQVCEPASAVLNKRVDRCRAFFAAYKATMWQGQVDCRITVAGSDVTTRHALPPAPAVQSVARAARTSISPTSFTIGLRRPRC
jgi:hypothetical protein